MNDFIFALPSGRVFQNGWFGSELNHGSFCRTQLIPAKDFMDTINSDPDCTRIQGLGAVVSESHGSQKYGELVVINGKCYKNKIGEFRANTLEVGDQVGYTVLWKSDISREEPTTLDFVMSVTGSEPFTSFKNDSGLVSGPFSVKLTGTFAEVHGRVVNAYYDTTNTLDELMKTAIEDTFNGKGLIVGVGIPMKMIAPGYAVAAGHFHGLVDDKVMHIDSFTAGPGSKIQISNVESLYARVNGRTSNVLTCAL